MTKIQRKVPAQNKLARSLINKQALNKPLRRSSLFTFGQPVLPPIRSNKSFGSSLILRNTPE